LYVDAWRGRREMQTCCFFLCSHVWTLCVHTQLSSLRSLSFKRTHAHMYTLSFTQRVSRRVRALLRRRSLFGVLNTHARTLTLARTNTNTHTQTCTHSFTQRVSRRIRASFCCGSRFSVFDCRRRHCVLRHSSRLYREWTRIHTFMFCSCLCRLRRSYEHTFILTQTHALTILKQSKESHMRCESDVRVFAKSFLTADDTKSMARGVRISDATSR
jgi:hypothetical protein